MKKPKDCDRFVVEFFGYNDGVPYKVVSCSDIEEARSYMEASIAVRPKVTHRLIEVVEETA